MWKNVADFPPKLHHSQSVSLDLDQTRLLLIFMKDRSREEVENFLKAFNLVLEDHQDHSSGNLPRYTSRVTHSKREFWARTLDRAPLSDAVVQGVVKKIGSHLESIAPVYQFPHRVGRDGIVSPLPSILLVRKKPDLSAIEEKQLDQVLGQYGLTVVASISRYLSFHKYCALTQPIGRTTHELLEQIPRDIPHLVSGASINPKRMLSNHAEVALDGYYQPNTNGLPQGYQGQWNLVKIEAGAFVPATTGWDKAPSKGEGIFVCVIDSGIESAHQEFLDRFHIKGEPLGNDPHGTACAGVIGASQNSNPGIAGIAGNCTFISFAIYTTDTSAVAVAINRAVEEDARVINMSFGWKESEIWPDHKAEIETALKNAYETGVVLCASAGNNELPPGLLYPAKASDRVIACGATNNQDRRCTEADWGSDNGIPYRSNFGDGLSVVAPGVDIPTTDLAGSAGLNTAGAYPDYVLNFWGTSAATAHVSGLAALLLGEYPGLTPNEVRSIIEETADQVGIYVYITTGPAGSKYPGKGWNNEMGYGRINVLSALNRAPAYASDVFIKDWSGDAGTVPSAPPGGNYWEFSDIVVHSTNDVAAGPYVVGTFDPSDVIGSSSVQQGIDNYLFVRVTNNGPSPARNVVIDARIVSYVGLAFTRNDWVDTDGLHLRPNPITNTFPNVPPGASFIAAFTILAAQVSTAVGWHPCILASVRADNDYGFPSASASSSQTVLDFNNLAQRNVSVITVLPKITTTVRYPFVIIKHPKEDKIIELLIDMGLLGEMNHTLTVVDSPTDTFPELNDIATIENLTVVGEGGGHDQSYPHAAPITKALTAIRIQPVGPPMQGKHYVLALNITIPPNVQPGARYPIRLRQRNKQKEVVGGATAIVVIGEEESLR